MKRSVDSFFPGRNECLVVAEISANHNQNLGTALRLIKKAKECGADAVKFQTYTPLTLTIDSDNKYFRIKHRKWGGQTLYELYSEAYTPWAWFKTLKKAADDNGLLFFSTAFDRTSVDFLEKLNVPFHKLASFELVDLPLIEYISKTGKPLILSTGMAKYSEIKEAVDTARRWGAANILLLKCVSSYPARPDDMNLKTIGHMKKSFDCPVGLSDHSLGTDVAVAAVCMGAQMVEKHFTISRKTKTPDSFFSIEPTEMKRLVNCVRTAEKSIGKVFYGPSRDEAGSMIFRRSLFVVKDVARGQRFNEENIRSIRPSGGLHPKYIKDIIGKKASRNIKAGTPLKRSFISITKSNG